MAQDFYVGEKVIFPHDMFLYSYWVIKRYNKRKDTYTIENNRGTDIYKNIKASELKRYSE